MIGLKQKFQIIYLSPLQTCCPWFSVQFCVISHTSAFYHCFLSLSFLTDTLSPRTFLMSFQWAAEGSTSLVLHFSSFPRLFKDTLHNMTRFAMFWVNSFLGITLSVQKYFSLSLSVTCTHNSDSSLKLGALCLTHRLVLWILTKS